MAGQRLHYAAPSVDAQRPTAPARALHLALLALILAGCGLVGAGGGGTSAPPPPTSPYSRFATAEQAAYAAAVRHVGVTLPTRPGAPAPGLPPGAFGPGVGSHLVLGFLPSWELASTPTVDYHALSEIGYYALQVEAKGTLLHSGQGWESLVNGSVAPLVADAHANGVRALLTLYSGTQSTLASLAADPASGRALADRVAPLLASHSFDGVDLDLEGRLASARQGFTAFVAAFSSRLRQIDPSWTIVLNTFPQAAVDPESFFDVKALAPLVDQLFVMAYDMGDPAVPGPTAPLVGAELSDASSLASYLSEVPARKIILGVPFYGYDFTSSSSTLPAVTVGSPYAVTYDAVAATHRLAHWDPVTDTAYLSFRRGTHWHLTFFDDPLSIALKVALASAFHVAGVGAWELGMVSQEQQMASTLDGGSRPLRLPLASQP